MEFLVWRFTSLQHFAVDCIRSYRVGQFKLFSNNSVHVLEIDHSSERNAVSGPWWCSIHKIWPSTNPILEDHVWNLHANCIRLVSCLVCSSSLKMVMTRGVECMDVGEALLPYRNATKLKKKISYFKLLINLRTYNKHIASFNVFNKPFIRI
jgi:hypothetical protein